MAETQLASADIQHQFYEQYTHNLERLWLEVESQIVDDKEALDRFFVLKSTEDEHIIPTNQLCAFFRLNTKIIHDQSDEYVRQIFFPGPEADATTRPA